MDSLTQELKANFPFDDFREGQRVPIKNLNSGKDCLVLLPTGLGKSLLYQFFAKRPGSFVLVVSPLIALMEDQTKKAQQLGISATCLHSLLGPKERERRQAQIFQQQFSLVFCTPERFAKSEFWAVLPKLSLFVVDEAHCISQWGHDFRPDYSKLGEIRKKLGQPQCLAVTATATAEVQHDIVTILQITKDQILRGGIERPNLSLNVHEAYGFDEKLDILMDLVKKSQDGAHIVYFSLIDTLIKVSRELQHQSIGHLVYHGELKPHLRKKMLKTFMSEKSPLILATPAFGLGVDKENVRSVIHFELPGSLEAYFQEVGRAGRDFLPSRGELLFDEEDTHIQMEFLKWSHPDEEFVRQVYKIIDEQSGALQESGEDYIRERLNYKNRRDYRVEAAINILRRWNCLQETNSAFPYVTVQEPGYELFMSENSTEQLKRRQMKLLSMLRWAKNLEVCRMKIIYDYFEDRGAQDCGKCDICLRQKL